MLFTFLAERYERRSVLITSNLVFSEWNKIFQDPMTTACAIDRLVHHAVILELSGASYRAEAAKQRADKPASGRPPLPPDPHHPGRWPDGVWKAAAPTPHPAPSHTPWKTLRVSHSPPATTASPLYLSLRKEDAQV